MHHRSTLFYGALAGGWFAAAYGCSVQEPNFTPRHKITSSAGGDEASGSDGDGGDTINDSGDTTTGGSGGAQVDGLGGGEGGNIGTGGVSSTGGAAGASRGVGAGTGGAAGNAGAAGAGGSSVVSGQCNAACMQGSDCSPKSCWMVSASAVKTDTTIQPTNAIDGDEKTRYSTGADAKGVEWFEIDLCRPTTVSGMDVYTGSGGGDIAEKYTVQVSLDGTEWTEVLHSDTPQAARATFTFAPVSARYVRYNETAMMTHWWSIHELDIVCGSADGG